MAWNEAPNFTRKKKHSKPSARNLGESERSAHSGELVAGVADEHAGLAHRAVADRDALDEPGGAGRHGRARLSPILQPREGEKRERKVRGDGRGGTERVLAFLVAFGA